jgi:hypothetical protein
MARDAGTDLKQALTNDRIKRAVPDRPENCFYRSDGEKKKELKKPSTLHEHWPEV